MTKVIADQQLRSKLNGLNQQLEVCDEAGCTLGHFLPTAIYKKLFYKLLASECPYNPEELEQMHQATGGRPLAELWRELGVA